MDITPIVIGAAVSFIVTYRLVPFFIEFGKKYGITGKDSMRPNKPSIPEIGGPPVLFGFILGLVSFIIVSRGDTGIINSAIGVASLTVLIGLFDTLTHLGKKVKMEGFEKKQGYPKWAQPLVFVLAALPLSIYSINRGEILLPIIGHVNIGLLFPLLLVPIGITGAANATNIFAGFDGLQASLGIVTLSFIGLFSFQLGSPIGAVIAFVFAGALAAFLMYNKYPSKIFPGSLDYLVGAMIGTSAIIGHVIFYTLVIFTPWIIEFVLHARGKFKTENYGILQKDGHLKPKYEKNYSILHVIMRSGKFDQKTVTAIVVSLVFIWDIIMYLLLMNYYYVIPVT